MHSGEGVDARKTAGSFGVTIQYYRKDEMAAYRPDFWTLMEHIGATHIRGAVRRWAADDAEKRGMKIQMSYTAPPYDPTTMEDYFKSKEAMRAHLDKYNIAQYRNHKGVDYHVLAGEPCGGYLFDPRNPPQEVLNLIEVLKDGMGYIRSLDPTHPVTLGLNQAGAWVDWKPEDKTWIDRRRAWIGRFIDDIDILDYHYYPRREAGQEWWRDPVKAQARWIEHFDQVLMPSRQGKPVVIGETGCPSNGCRDWQGNMAQFTEQNQADFYRLYGEVTRPREIFVYQYKLIDATGYDAQNASYGLFNREDDGTMNTPKLAAGLIKDYLSVGPEPPPPEPQVVCPECGHVLFSIRGLSR